MKMRDEKPAADPNCPICGGDRRLVIERNEFGAPASCAAYHPGYDYPGIRRYDFNGKCWLVGADGIKRRDPARDMEVKREAGRDNARRPCGRGAQRIAAQSAQDLRQEGERRGFDNSIPRGERELGEEG